MDPMLDRWAAVAATIQWQTPWETLWDSDDLPGRWFVGGELNVATNCLDRHLERHSDRVAVIWEGEPGDQRAFTYGDLHVQTCALARSLEGLGITAGDRVALFLGGIPELIVAALGCARIGAVTSLLPASLPAAAAADRLVAFQPRIVVAQDGAWRHGVVLPIKARLDEALEATTSIEHVVVVRRTGMDIAWYDSDRWYHELVAPEMGRADHPAPALAAEHPLFVHYVPGSDPLRGVVQRTAGIVAAATAIHRYALAPDSDDVLWPALEVAYSGWTAHGLLGPLLCGATLVAYEGMLDTPSHDRTWQIIERYGVTSVLTFPTVVHRLRDWWSSGVPTEHLRSLRRVATLGEPLEEPERKWLTEAAGGRPLVVLDGWGQHELGGIAAFTPSPESAALPDPGRDVVDEAGCSLPAGVTGELVLRHPWPATSLNPIGEPDRYSKGPDGTALYRTGDLARRNPDGHITLVERLDRMVKVLGQYVSPVSVADVLTEHPMVAAAEVVQVRDEKAGRFLVAWVVPEQNALPSPELASELRKDLHEMLGGLSVPHAVGFVEAFPPGLSATHLRVALRNLGMPDGAPVITATADDLMNAARSTEV